MAKISVIGAGAVGATTAYSLSKESFINEVTIVDIDKGRAEGNALDIMHGVALMQPMYVKYGTYEDTAGSDIVIITVGVPEKVGESRLIPLKKNIGILEEIVPKIIDYSPDCCILVVSNPVDILSYFTHKISGLPKERVIGLGTSLDTSRLQYLLGRDLSVAPECVDTMIVGEHGDSQVVLWSKTKVAGVSIDAYANLIDLKLPANYEESIESEVKQTAFDVWEMKGPNCYCVAETINRVVRAIVRNEKTILPVSNLYKTKGGEELYTSLPSLISSKGVDKQLQIPLEDEENKRFKDSCNLLLKLISQINQGGEKSC